MSAESFVIVKRWQVGDYTVTLSIPRPRAGAVICASAEWEPHMPERLTPDEQRQYEAGRDRAMAEVMRAMTGKGKP